MNRIVIDEMKRRSSSVQMDPMNLVQSFPDHFVGGITPHTAQRCA